MKIDIETRRTLIARRTLAFLLDHLIFTIAAGVFVVLFIEKANNAYGVEVLFYSVPLLMIMSLYFFKEIINGKSIGKKVMGIQVRSSENINKVPSLGRLILRNITIVFWPIEFIILIFNKDVKKIGDMMSGTTVVIEAQVY